MTYRCEPYDAWIDRLWSEIKATLPPAKVLAIEHVPQSEEEGIARAIAAQKEMGK